MSTVDELTAADAGRHLEYEYYDDEGDVQWSSFFDGINTVTVVAIDMDNNETVSWKFKLVSL